MLGRHCLSWGTAGLTLSGFEHHAEVLDFVHEITKRVFFTSEQLFGTEVICCSHDGFPFLSLS